MFKSIQFKVVSVFVLLTLSLITIVGSFMIINVVNFYNQEFFVMMDKVFNERFVNDLNQLARNPESLKNIDAAISSHIGPLGIDTYRFYSILDAKTGDVLICSDTTKIDGIDKTDNIVMAMSGKRGNIVDTEKNYMDYAVAINLSEENSYIVYIKDTKEELNSITKNVLVIVAESLLIAVLFSVIIGYLLGKTITVPIVKLTKRAEKLAAGEFDVMDASKENDEIGRLSNSFGYMSQELKKTIMEVNEEKTKVETILLNMTDGLLAFDLSGNLILINPEAEKFLEGENTQNLTFDGFFKKNNANITLGDLIYIKNENSLEREIQYNERYLKLNFATIEKDDKISGVLVVMRDITNQEKLEIARREFVSDVSHELRTPLTTVKSYAETLMDDSMTDRDLQNRFLSVIIKEADRMTRIVKDLLTLSKLDEAQTDTIEPDDIDLQVLLDGVVEKMYITAKKKGQTITYKPLNPVPIFKSNRDKLEQVVINIVSNAIKYTGDGGNIDVVSGKLYNDAFIKVIDNGIGIPKENLPRLFERFYRVDKARSRDTGGTGLGLAISKQIIESLGGSITINSDFGKGTEVILTFPIL